MSIREWPTVRAALLVGLALTGTRTRAGALNNPNQFCIGNPCIISSPKSADANVVLDFGTRTVILQNTITMSPMPSGALGSLTIKAGSFTISGNGQIRGFSSTVNGGAVTIQAINTIQINDTSGSGAIRLSGQDGGALTLTTSTGAVTVSGRVTLFGDGIPASGGSLTINAATDITFTGELDIYGGSQGIGGDVDFTAGGNVFLGLADLSGGEIGGGSIDILATGSVTLGQIEISGGGLGGDAGFVTIDSGANVRFQNDFRGLGADNGADCGDGADVDVTAGGDITIAGEMDIRGRGLDCSGGSLSLDAARAFLQSDLMMSGTGSQGTGGDLDILTTTLLRVTGSIELDGGDSGGDILVASDAEMELLGTIIATGRTTIGTGSSLVDFQAGKLTISGTIDASSGSSTAEGPPITMSACDVITNPSTSIRALGSNGSISIEARDAMKLRGKFLASSTGGIQLRYSNTADPPDTAGASFSPSPTRVLDSSLVPCRVCETDAECADSDPCTDDVCNVTACLNTPHEGKPCSDGDPCTVGDACSGGVCVSGPRGTCNDADGDGKVDDADECTTLSWTAPPTIPPDQNPLKFLLTLKRLSGGPRKVSMLLKGLFSVAPSMPLVIDPTANGVHVYIEDAVGPVFNLSLPGGTGCIPDEGWETLGVGFHKTWRYSNITDSLPPGCSNGSAYGMKTVQIKDKRRTRRGGLQFKIRASEATLLRDLVPPLTRLQITLGLGAESFPGVATPQAKAGQCGEALFTGDPIPSSPAPACRSKLKDAVLDRLICKGE